MQIDFPAAYEELFRPHRYKVYYGGRGSGKSWNVARALLIRGMQENLTILCTREVQNSISDSVHRLLREQIDALNLNDFYRITQNSIYGANGTEFIFKGLKFNVREVKSTEGVNICWCEEAQAISEESWDVLIPTIRQENSEIWVTFNPLDATDPTYKRFIEHQPPEAYVRKVNYDENPFFPDVLRKEAEWTKQRDYEAYLHIWQGEVRRVSNSLIFANRFKVEEFETPKHPRFYHGADWGFAKDPSTLIRCFIDGKKLYIDREAWGVGVEIDKLPELFDTIETAREWSIKADSARPETISYMRRQHFNIKAAKKWAGSIEDGIEFLKSFDIVIHPRCVHTIDEFNHYSYKVDKMTNDILPVVVDSFNHCIDALRYSLDGMIKGKTGDWKALIS